MTGSIAFNRQHSSTAGCAKVDKRVRRKLRRWSSVDDQNLFEVIIDDNENKNKSPNKRNQTPSDSDSGVEDLDPQVTNYDCAQSNHADQEESIPDFGACDDEEAFDEQIASNITGQVHDSEQQVLDRIHNDLTLAAQVPDTEKKDFCQSTIQVFHAEFARRFAWPISLQYPGVGYYLFAEEQIDGVFCQCPVFDCLKLDNAKAQFRCPNEVCRRLWTSMRARISFKITAPQHYGFVVLKIYGQNCEHCGTLADALWYPEEVCRVIKNLTTSVFGIYFPSMLTNDDDLQDGKVTQTVDQSFRRLRHDPHQRQGKMHAPHNKALCEACQYGWCFA